LPIKWAIFYILRGCIFCLSTDVTERFRAFNSTLVEWHHGQEADPACGPAPAAIPPSGEASLKIPGLNTNPNK
jgi:hypothetical protein